MQNIMQLSEKFIYSIMQTESWVTDDGKKKNQSENCLAVIIHCIY